MLRQCVQGGPEASHFSYPQGGFGGDQGDKIPHWLMQKMVLARAHALFSHLEDDIRNGELLPGPHPHRWSKDQPAYEFPIGNANLRVLGRKHQSRETWLIVAWAADGNDRDATVSIPGLGQITLQARDCGSVYRASKMASGVRLEQLDENGMLTD